MMNLTLDAIIDAYDAGELTPYQAARALAMELGEVESTLAPLNDERARIRVALERVMRKHGEPIDLAGFGRMEIVPDSTSARYDRATVEAVIAELANAGMFELAQRLATGRRESARAGGLRVTPEKKP